jgi:hypothetical protein
VERSDLAAAQLDAATCGARLWLAGSTISLSHRVSIFQTNERCNQAKACRKVGAPYFIKIGQHGNRVSHLALVRPPKLCYSAHP